VIQKGGRWVDPGDIHENAGPKAETIQSEAVSAHRCLGLSAAREIIPDVLAEIAARLNDDLLTVTKSIVIFASDPK